MAFLKNLFGGKDASFYLNRGNRLFAEGRYAEAKVAYGDALEKLGSDDGTLRDEITTRRGEAGDALAIVNLEEAEHCLIGGDAVIRRCLACRPPGGGQRRQSGPEGDRTALRLQGQRH